MQRHEQTPGGFGTERGRSPSGVPNPPGGGNSAPGGTPASRKDPQEYPERLEDFPEPSEGLDPQESGYSPRSGSPEEPEPWTPGGFVDSYPRPRRRGRRLVKATEKSRESFTPEQRLLLLDTWLRSGLPAGDFAPLVGVSKHTLYAWKKRFTQQGPAGLLDPPAKGPREGRLSDLTRRTILMLKETNPEFGCRRISDMLFRGPALPASAATVAKVLHEAGYVLEEEPTSKHPPKVQRFERDRPNRLWQTDLFTFVLKRQNRRVYLVCFMDDHSRFIVGYGLHATQSAALVIEVLRQAIASYQAPEEVLTDNGSQYVTWRGKSAFSRELEQRGIRHVVASPHRPQTLGKVERFWGSLWRECVQRAVFLDLADAQKRVGLYIDYYNFQRVHQGIGGLVPADRYFHAAPEVLRTLKERVAENALKMARQGVPRPPFYLTGNAGGKTFSVHAEGERVILRRGEGEREEIDLSRKPEVPDRPQELPQPLCPCGTPGSGSEGSEDPAEPGTSALDALTPCVEEGASSADSDSTSDDEGDSDDTSDPDPNNSTPF